MNRLLSLLVLISALFLNFPAQAELPFLHASGREIVDDSGNWVRLRGMNYDLVQYDTPYPFDPKMADAIRAGGFNFVRLPIEWQLLEPTPGEIDYAYLDQVESIVQYFANLDVYVLIDMHQWNTTDCFSALFGTGFPAWFVTDVSGATIAPWTCAATDTANAEWKQNVFWTQFWSNPTLTVAPYAGTKAWDAYANIWRVVAWRLRNYPNVAGWDILNEPHSGYLTEQQLNTSVLPQFYNYIGTRIRWSDWPDANSNFHHILVVEGQDGDVKPETVAPELSNFVLSQHVYPDISIWSDQCQLTLFVNRGMSLAHQWNVPYLAGEFGTNGQTNDADPRTVVLAQNLGIIFGAYGQSWSAWDARNMYPGTNDGFINADYTLTQAGINLANNLNLNSGSVCNQLTY